MITNDNLMNKFFSKVYLWMFLGLLISGSVGYYSSVNYNMISFISKFYYLIIILELIVVISFTALKNKVSTKMASLMFIIYSIISGLTLSSIFLIYSLGSIVKVFISSAVLFGILAIYGYITKNDLSNLGKLFIIGLFIIIVVSIINIFIGSNKLDIGLSIISVVLFLGLTAWDMQSLKNIYYYYSNDEESLKKTSIYGALSLYLDFINIFLDLLRLFGSRKK